MSRGRLGAAMNADFHAVRRTADQQVAEARPGERVCVDPVGPVAGRTSCPLCRTHVEVMQIGARVQGRCTGCTVMVRVVDGRTRAAGWMGGGDMVKAGAALRLRRSKYERTPKLPAGVEEPVQQERPDTSTLPAGEGACLEQVGSRAGANRHYRAREPLCEECREARNAYRREQKLQARIARAERRAREAKA